MTSMTDKQILAQIKGIGNVKFGYGAARTARFFRTLRGDDRRAVIQIGQP
jgi:hypothetical protein